jgi:iron complex outermembrane receptor protein
VVFAPYVNKGEAEVSGIDFDFSYRWTTRPPAASSSTRIGRAPTNWKLIDGGVTTDYAGTHGNCDVSNCIGTPKDKVVMTLNWDYQAFGVWPLYNWRSSMSNYADTSGGRASTPSPMARTPRTAARSLVLDAGRDGRWDITKQIQLYGSIANVTDRVAPLDPTTYGAINYNPMDVSGAMGRYYRLGLKWTFR